MGPQYVRGILEGNGEPPDGNLWLAYSVNKEDIWVSRVPVPVSSRVEDDVADDFAGNAPGSLPATWNVYRPLWAPVEVLDTNSAQGNALSLSDSDPWDYASVSRVFPEAQSVLIRLRLRAEQTDARLEIDVADAEGLRPVQIALTADGRVQARHEGIWKPAGDYAADRWFDVEIDVNPGQDVDRYHLRVDGKEVLFRPAYFTDPARTVERLTIRTGKYRRRGSGGEELDDADRPVRTARFWIDDVRIVANRAPES
jgi:Sialidase-like, CBM domain